MSRVLLAGISIIALLSSVPSFAASLYLTVGSATPINANTCTKYTVSRFTSNGTAAPAGQDLTVTLTGNSLGSFYDTSDTTCSKSTVGSVTMLTGSSTVDFYFSDPSADSPNLTAASAGATPGSFQVTVNAPAANGFYIAPPPTGNDKTGLGTVQKPYATLGKCQTAMQNNPSKNTCYLMAGTYGLSDLPATTIGDTGTNTIANVALNLGTADNGTTWTYYPPDGPNKAILDGGNHQTGANAYCQNTAFLDIGIYIGGASNITVNGLFFQNFSFGAVLIHGGRDLHGNWVPTGKAGEGAANFNTISNNIVQNIMNGPNPNAKYGGNQGGCPPNGTVGAGGTYTSWPNGANPDNDEGGLVYAHGPISNLTITNNVGINMMSTCIQLDTQFDAAMNAPAPADNFDNLVVTGNFCSNTGTAAFDVGAIHLRLFNGQNEPASATGAVISNNYTHDCGGASGNTIPGSSKCIYMDDLTSGVTLNNNVMSGHFAYAADIHGGKSNIWTNNIVDLTDSADGGDQKIMLYQDDPNDCTGGTICNMAGNVWQSNIVISKNGIQGDGGFSNMSSDTALTKQDDLYWGYGSATPSDDSTGAINKNPLFSADWNYVLQSGSPAFGAPVKFTQPAHWGTPGYWGPADYTIPTGTNAGTKPSPL